MKNLNIKIKQFTSIVLLTFNLSNVGAQINNGNMHKVSNSECYMYHNFDVKIDSLIWDGDCDSLLVSGYGNLSGYTDNNEYFEFCGKFKKGLMQGDGKLSWSGKTNKNGNYKYSGHFVNSIFHGFGEMTYNDSLKFEGFFFDNEPYSGAYITKYSVEYLNRDYYDAYKENIAAKYNPLIGDIQNEYFDDKWKRCRQDSASYIREVTYSQKNIPSGIVRIYYISGNLHSEFSAKYLDYYDNTNNFYDGKNLTFNEDGKLIEEKHYQENKKHGVFKNFNSNGEITFVTNYENNMSNWEAKFIYGFEGHHFKSLEYSEKELNTFRTYFGEHHVNCADEFFFIGDLQGIYLGNYNLAEESYKEAIRIYKKNINTHFKEYYTSTARLVKNYIRKGFYELAQKTIIDFFAENEKVICKDSAYLEQTLELKIELSKIEKDYQKCKGYYGQTLEYNEYKYSKHSRQYANALSKYASFLSTIGKDFEALKLNKDALEIVENLNESNNYTYILYLKVLAESYNTNMFYNQGLYLYEKVLEIHKKNEASNKFDNDYFDLVQNIANSYNKFGKFSKAIFLIEDALEKMKSLDGEYEESTLSLKNLLAQSYYGLGFVYKPISFLEEVVEVARLRYGSGSSIYFTYVYNLLFYRFYNDQLNANENEETIELILEKVEEIYGRNSEKYVTYLNNLAKWYFRLKNYEKSIEYNLEAINIVKNLFGTENHDFNFLYTDLALSYKAGGYTAKCINVWQTYNELTKNNINKIFSYFSENDKENFISENLRNLFTFINHMQYDSIIKTREIYNEIVFNKGLVLNSQVITFRRLNESEDESLNILKSQNRDLKKLLGKQFSIPTIKRNIDIDSLKLKINDYERRINGIVSIQSDLKSQENDYFCKIEQSLNDNESVLEFFHYNYLENENFTDSVLYFVLVINKGESKPKLIKLFDNYSILKLFNNGVSRESSSINNLYKSVELYNLIWKDIEKHIPIGSKVYYSPSGLLHKIQLGAIKNPTGEYLSEKYQFELVRSTGMISNKNEEKEILDITLFGGMDYEAEEQDISKSIANINNDVDYVSRGLYIQDSTRSGKWSYLPGTKKEAENINNISKDANIPAKLYMGTDALEEQYKNLDGDKSPSILHIATHGFFFPDPKVSKEKLDRLAFHTDNPFTIADNPMNRSGLLFTGSNKAWVGDSISLDLEDGILTAYEASHTYLKNTELVVLSACETGLGDIIGSEGVYGLQRAFKMAGARYLMMSLWKVPDNATQEFMTTFYTELLTHKKSIRDAYNATQKLMRDKYRDEPYKWGGFVLME